MSDERENVHGNGTIVVIQISHQHSSDGTSLVQLGFEVRWNDVFSEGRTENFHEKLAELQRFVDRDRVQRETATRRNERRCTPRQI